MGETSLLRNLIHCSYFYRFAKDFRSFTRGLQRPLIRQRKTGECNLFSYVHLPNGTLVKRGWKEMDQELFLLRLLILPGIINTLPGSCRDTRILVTIELILCQI
jgi:hypothetical protein